MWKSKIKSKALSRGVLSVVVSYVNEDTGEAFDEEYNASQAQTDDWPVKQIKERLKHMNALELGAHAVPPDGTDITEDKPAEGGVSIHDLEAEEYKQQLVRFEKFVAALAKGVVDPDYEEFIALKQWLKEHFKSEYLNFFW